LTDRKKRLERSCQFQFSCLIVYCSLVLAIMLQKSFEFVLLNLLVFYVVFRRSVFVCFLGYSIYGF